MSNPLLPNSEWQEQLSPDSTEQEVFSAIESYDQLLAASYLVPQAAVVLVRVRKHRSIHHSTVSLDEAYQYKRGRALGTIAKPPRPRGIPRQLRKAAPISLASPLPPPPSHAPTQQQQRQQEHRQPESSSTTPSPPHDVPENSPTITLSSTAATVNQLTALIARVEQQEHELGTLRTQLERVVRLAEQVNTEVALFRQELLPQRVETRTSTTSRKRKQSALPHVEIDPASLLDQQTEQHIDHCFVSWRLEENGVTTGWACINAVLTLFNHHLQQVGDTHVRFLTSYPGMETQDSDDPVFERCMGIDLSTVRYVAAPVSVRGNHWALIVCDNEQRQLLLVDSLDLVTGKQGTRMRRLLMRGRGKAKAAIRIRVVRQKDNVSCGLFLLCFACYMVKNGGTWRESISDATFCIDSMRQWIERLKVPNKHVEFTLEQLPAFASLSASSTNGEGNLSSGTH